MKAEAGDLNSTKALNARKNGNEGWLKCEKCDGTGAGSCCLAHPEQVPEA